MEAHHIGGLPATCSDALLEAVAAQQATKQRFFQVSAFAQSRPFQLREDPPEAFQWLEWAPLSRVVVQDMIHRLGDVWDEERYGEAPSNNLLHAIAAQLGGCWFDTATGGERQLSRHTAWRRRRGWQATANTAVATKGTFAWQLKLVRLSTRQERGPGRANSAPLRRERGACGPQPPSCTNTRRALHGACALAATSAARYGAALTRASIHMYPQLLCSNLVFDEDAMAGDEPLPAAALASNFKVVAMRVGRQGTWWVHFAPKTAADHEADAAAEEDAALLEEVVEHGGSEEEDLDHDACDASSGIEAV